MKSLKEFKYTFDKGPVEFSAIDSVFLEGNCRMAVQNYFYVRRNVYLSPEEILCPNSYRSTGIFVYEPTDVIDFEQLQEGDWIFAEKYRNSKGDILSRIKSSFPNEDDWLISLHTAVYLGTLSPEIREILPNTVTEKGFDVKKKYIWHATTISGGTCLWTVEEFLNFYKPIAIKRLKD